MSWHSLQRVHVSWRFWEVTYRLPVNEEGKIILKLEKTDNLYIGAVGEDYFTYFKIQLVNGTRDEVDRVGSMYFQYYYPEDDCYKTFATFYDQPTGQFIFEKYSVPLLLADELTAPYL